jgi:hypothetical protein
MNSAWVFKMPWKYRVVRALVAAGICIGVVVGSLVLFGLVLPSLGPGSGGLSRDRSIQDAAYLQQAINSYWGDKNRSIVSALNWVSIFALSGLLLWGMCKLIMFCCRLLDQEGYWGRGIARRDSGCHHHR